MITKIVPSPKGGGRFGDLAAYVANGRRQVIGLGTEGQGEAWSRLGSYVMDEAGDGEKVAASWTRNFGSDNLAWCLKMSEATQKCAPARSGGAEGKTMHVVVSFARGERLDLDTMKAIEERIAKTLGLEEHQRIAGIHQNTECWHMHMAINKVHPESLRTVTPYRAWPKLRVLCREIEQEHGLKATELSRGAERYLADGAARMEIHEGRESFAVWAREYAREPLLEARDAGGGWQGVHKVAARFGMDIKPRGAGLVLSPAGVDGYGIKASTIDRGLGMKAMTDRLGPYEPAQLGQDLPAAEVRYMSEPLQKSTDAKALSVAFDKVRADALETRDRAFKAMQAEQEDYRKRIDDWTKAERERIRHGRLAAFDPDKYGKLKALDLDRKRMLTEAKEARRKAGAVIRERHPIPSWQGFLEDRAGEGDEAALGTLRERQGRGEAIAETIIAAETAMEARHVIRMGMKRQIRRDGTVAYSLGDGGIVLDRAGQIEIAAETRASAEFALNLAVQRFGSVPLAVKGSGQFTDWAIEAGSRQGAGVQFADPELERRRSALVDQRRDALDLEDVAAYVAAERGLKEPKPTPGFHTWSMSDAGTLAFEGRVPLRDGSHAVIWKQGADVIVQRETPELRDVTRNLARGDQVEIGRDGRPRDDLGH